MDVTTLFKFAAEYGLFPVLFVFAFIYIIKEAKEREKAQRTLYEKLSEDVEAISSAITVVEESIKRTDSNVSQSTQSSERVAQEVTHIKYMIGTLEAVIKSYARK